MLGRLLFAVAILGIVSALCGCAPGEVPPKHGDNVRCKFSGLSEYSVRGYLRMSFGFDGGTVKVTGGGLPFDLLCEVAPEGEVFPEEA